jgi:multidrug efflux pump subunit AcrA (membrane-fusion protein)
MEKKHPFDIVVTMILLVCVGVLTLASIFTLTKSSGSDLSGAIPSMAQMMPGGAFETSSTAIVVSVSEATTGTLYKTTRLYGSLTYESSVEVFPAIAGQLNSYQVAVGDLVQEGQVLALIDPSKPGSEYVLSKIYAPVSAVVVALSKSIGDTISLSTAIVSLRPIDTSLKLTLDLPERYLASILEGMTATFSTVAWPGERHAAVVETIGLDVDKTSRSIPVQLRVLDTDSRLKSGMFVTVDLVTAKAMDSIIIPRNAIGSYLNNPVVYVVSKQLIVERRAVEVGLTTDHYVQVLDGLEAGELVVVAGSVSSGDVVVISETVEGYSL